MKAKRWLCAVLILGACSTSKTPATKNVGDAGSPGGGTGGATLGTGGGSAGVAGTGGVSGNTGGSAAGGMGGSGAGGAGGGACTPSAPRNVTATPGDRQVELRWMAASANCGNAVTGYAVTQTPSDKMAMAGPGATSLVMSGLTNGTAYTFTVAAVSAAGMGPVVMVMAMPRGAPALPQFPVVASPTGRYLQDQAGKPFRIQGDSAWALINETDLAGVRTYFADRRARGVNAVVMQASIADYYWEGGASPGALGAGGAKPFLRNASGGAWTAVWANHDVAFDSPNDVYWNWVDVVIREAAAHGILVLIDPMYWGYNFGAEGGWWKSIGKPQNTQAVCYNFGKYLGARWKDHPNLIINLGTDMFPTSGSEDSARALKIVDGMRDAGCKQLVSAHYKRSSDSLDYPDYASRITFNSVYPGTGAGAPHAGTYARTRAAYARSPARPMAVVETVYEGEGGKTREQYRSLGWWSAASGAGYFFGNRVLELFQPPWRNHLESDGIRDHQRMGEFLDSMAWHLLVPDGLGTIGTLVTAGGGGNQTLSPPGTSDGTEGLDHVSAAATPDGATLIAYVPHAHSGSVTIDMTKLRGMTVQRWYDPTTGTYQSAGPNLPNTGTHAFTPPAAHPDGSRDWVLRLDAQ
jgi:hypothetical protein